MKLRNLKLVVVLLCCGTVMAARSYFEVAPRDLGGRGIDFPVAPGGPAGPGAEDLSGRGEFAGPWTVRAGEGPQRADSAQIGRAMGSNPISATLADRGEAVCSNSNSGGGPNGETMPGPHGEVASGTSDSELSSARMDPDSGRSNREGRARTPGRVNSRAKVISIHVESGPGAGDPEVRTIDSCGGVENSATGTILVVPQDEPALMVPGSWGSTLGS